jgi:hypothetical protein
MNSKYHNLTYLSGILYYVIAPISLLTLYFIIENLEINGL